MKTHELKTWPVFYKDIINGTKTFEVRTNDRDFQVGDILLLREYDPDAESYTGEKTERKISYILGDNPFFQLNKLVIMGLQPIEPTLSRERVIEVLEKYSILNAYIGSTTILKRDFEFIADELCDTKESDIIKALSGEQIEDIPSFTSTDYPDEPKPDINTTKDLIIAKQKELIKWYEKNCTSSVTRFDDYSYYKHLKKELQELKDKSKG
jgi:hypothetical protein